MNNLFQEKLINIQLSGWELNNVVAVLSEFCDQYPDSYEEVHKIKDNLFEILEQNDCMVCINDTACSSWKDVD